MSKVIHERCSAEANYDPGMRMVGTISCYVRRRPCTREATCGRGSRVGQRPAESFELLAGGRGDAFANDDVQLYGMVAERKAAADFRVVGEFLTYADDALMFRKDDPEFAEVVDRAFHKLAGSREILAIYERWFLKGLPSGSRLNMPMSPHLEELFRVRGLPSD